LQKDNFRVKGINPVYDKQLQEVRVNLSFVSMPFQTMKGNKKNIWNTAWNPWRKVFYTPYKGRSGCLRCR